MSITIFMWRPDSRHAGRPFVAFLKCDPGARVFCKCANADMLPAILMLLPAASSVPAQKHALWKALDTHKSSDAWCTCLSVQTRMLTLLLTQLHIATKTNCWNNSDVASFCEDKAVESTLLFSESYPLFGLDCHLFPFFSPNKNTKVALEIFNKKSNTLKKNEAEAMELICPLAKHSQWVIPSTHIAVETLNYDSNLHNRVIICHVTICSASPPIRPECSYPLWKCK